MRCDFNRQAWSVALGQYIQLLQEDIRSDHETLRNEALRELDWAEVELTRAIDTARFDTDRLWVCFGPNAEATGEEGEEYGNLYAEECKAALVFS